jgi:hypothetical protein
VKSRRQCYDTVTLTAVTGTGTTPVISLLSWESAVIVVNVTTAGGGITLTPQGGIDVTNVGPVLNSVGTALTSGALSTTGRRVIQVPGPLPEYFAVGYNAPGAAVTATITVCGVKTGMP